MPDMPVDERSERIVDVVEDSEALLPEDVEVLRSELRRLRVIEEAAHHLLSLPPIPEIEAKYPELREAMTRLNLALDADRGGQGE